MWGGLIYTLVPVAACASSVAACACPMPAPILARVHSHSRPMASCPRPDTSPLRSGCARLKSGPSLDPMAAPTAVFERRVRARYHASARGVRTRSHVPLTHPSMPFPTSQPPPHPRPTASATSARL
jgi:hypothetical protein